MNILIILISIPRIEIKIKSEDDLASGRANSNNNKKLFLISVQSFCAFCWQTHRGTCVLASSDK